MIELAYSITGDTRENGRAKCRVGGATRAGQASRREARIISDNGPQFIAKDFKIFVRVTGLSHVRTSPCYPQSNGKLERFHGILKDECIRLTCPATKEEAAKQVQLFVQHHNHVRFHSAIGYVSPANKLAGLDGVIAEERDRKLEEARQRRELARNHVRQVA